MSIPKTMKAAILVEQRKPLIVDEIELPDVLDVGQVLVKIHYSGVCGSQIGEIDGVKGEDRFLPHLLGHEASATVVETGAGVRHVKPGDTVVLHWRKGIGIEAVPPSYRWQGNKVNAGWITTFSEYSIVSENRVTVIPDDSDLKVAALFGCAVTTGFGVVENDAKVKIGESVVVFGAGGVGLNIVQAAALVGAHPIIAVDIFDNRLGLAKEMGATHLINAKSEDAKLVINEIVASRGLDVFIDNTGKPSIIEMGYQMINSQGRIILVGVPAKGDNIKVYSLPLHFGKVMTGSHGGGCEPSLDIPRYHELYRSGRIRLRELFTDHFTLDEINKAIDMMRTGESSGRCLISMRED